MIFALGQCYLLAGVVFHSLERVGSRNCKTAPSGDGSVCSVLQCSMVSQDGAVLVMFSSLGCLLLDVVFPLLSFNVGLAALVPLAWMPHRPYIP